MNISISKHIKKPVLHGILSVIALGGASAGLLSSCSDFLDITPSKQGGSREFLDAEERSKCRTHGML